MKLVDSKLTMMLQEMEKLLVPLGTPSSKHSRSYWLRKQSKRLHHPSDVILFMLGDVRDYTSMHAYRMTAQDPQKVEESSMPVVSLPQEQ